MYGLYIGLLLGALNRLPIKLPRKGAGRRHSGNGTGSSTQHIVTFEDVAGVDEAKEELSEIVVWSVSLFWGATPNVACAVLLLMVVVCCYSWLAILLVSCSQPKSL